VGGTCGPTHRTFYDRQTRRVRDLSCGDPRIDPEVELRRVRCRSCRTVRQEKLPWLADNPFYTKRFAFYVGRRCRSSTLRDGARELGRDWKTVKALEMEYLRAQLRRARTPAPRGIGIDEISLRKGHTYRLVVSDLLRGRPIWFGGPDRAAASLDEFFAWLGPKKCGPLCLAVRDMGPAFRTATLKEGNAPQAAILYDKLHVLKHLGAAMDQVRKREYARLSGQDRRFLKGQRYTLLAHGGNLTAEGRAALKRLFGANKRRHTAYLLKESFGQLWDYRSPRGRGVSTASGGTRCGGNAWSRSHASHG